MKSEGKKLGGSLLIAGILRARGVTEEDFAAFLDPKYDEFRHDPFLFPDMKQAVARIVLAKKQGEKVTIYGDYDIDGMTATVILWESFRKFGLEVETYTPDRFTEGYGMNMDAIESIANSGAKLIITVDNGTLSFAEVARAKELGVDVIITDHHSPHETLPDAVAVLNPKVVSYRHPEKYDEKFVLKPANDAKLYPFCDLCGAGVAFKLVQALQTESLKTAAKNKKILKQVQDDSGGLIPMKMGQEKWLLDLVALGTVCDSVGLVDENRANVRWGLEVLKKTRRPGLRALVATAGATLAEVNVRTLGFVIGPRLNASGRLETAEWALELLKLHDDAENQADINARALELAEKLEIMNRERRKVQDEIFVAATEQIMCSDTTGENVAIAAGDDWHEGVIGIVAAKILERFERPAFILSIGKKFAKGSGRSFGDFSCAAAIHATDEIVEKGGGHLAAGGLTVRSDRLDEWKTAIQQFYKKTIKNPEEQKEFLYPNADVNLPDFADITEELLDEINQLEPFGQANRAPVFEFADVLIFNRRTMGKNNEHVKYIFADKQGQKFTAVAFGAAEKFTTEPFDQETGVANHANIRVELTENTWNGRTTIEGKLLKLT
jgi:single-stranded-DNA-specific exonuclease